MITPAQIRAARALIEWKQADLAAGAGLSIPTIKNVEGGSTGLRVSTLAAIEKAFQAAGVIFIENDGVRRTAALPQVRA